MLRDILKIRISIMSQMKLWGENDSFNKQWELAFTLIKIIYHRYEDKSKKNMQPFPVVPFCPWLKIERSFKFMSLDYSLKVLPFVFHN